MTPLLLAVSLALAAPQAFPLPDAGVTLNLSQGWHMTRWSNWDFTATSSDGTINLKVWTTPFQVPVTEASAAAWAEMYKAQLVGGVFESAEVLSTTVETVAGRPTAHVRLALRVRAGGGNAKVIANVMAFTGPAQVIHAYTLGLERIDGRLSKALMDLVTGLSVERGPIDTGGQKVVSQAGFEATLPEGWRAPLAEEMEPVLAVAFKLGEETLSPERCWVAIRPPPSGDPDLIFACKAPLYLGPVDEHSFEGVEPEVREKFFSKAPEPVAPAEPVPVGDRLGFYFKPGHANLRLAVAPYESVSVMMTWGLGNQIDAEGLDAAMKATLASVVFTGPDGGKPKIGADRWIGYFLKYRTFSPYVLGPVLLFIAGIIGLGRLMRRKPNPEI